MDDFNAQINPQGSVCSDSNEDEGYKIDVSLEADKRICLVGKLANDPDIYKTAEIFGVPIVKSDSGREYLDDNNCSTFFVIDNFESEIFNILFRKKRSILGPPALKQLAKRQNPDLPDNTRPLYNTSMKGCVCCFTGFRNKEELARLVPLIHHLGGSIRREMTAKVTHLIANNCIGDKYQYASTFRLPIINQHWVLDCWAQRDDIDFCASVDTFVAKYKLKPFHGARVCLLGFSEEEEKHMTEVLLTNGGTLTTLDDISCTHVVVDESNVVERPDPSGRPHLVKAEWFWTSVQKQISVEEKDYLFDDYIEQVLSPTQRRDSHAATPSSASRRKRKRIQDTLHTLVQQSPHTVCKRRSSVSDAGLLSVSGSFLDCTASPSDKGPLDVGEPILDTPRKGLTARHQVFLELLQTETNYVDILRTIMGMFKKHLEEMPEEEALLNNTELNLIFGKLPPIYEVHVQMNDEFRYYAGNWKEDKISIGNIIIKFSSQLMKAYPPFINYFEEMKEVLTQCDQNKPRFHAFLKACQTRPECGRQSLQELMIRPVQRLGSISLLISDILKNTPKSNPDHAALIKALEVLKEVMTHINEDKKKTEGQVTLFNIFNEIDNCPPDIVSSHRSYITKADVVQISSSEGLASKGNHLVLFLFSDQLEVCKKKSKAFNTAKSPSSAVTSFQMNKPATKPYKHVKLIPLNTVKKVIDIKETDDCQKVFSLVCRNNDEIKERLYSFAIADDEADKVGFLKTFTKQMATNSCTADPDKFIAYLEPQQLDIDTSDLSNGTFSKAFKFASKTRMKVERAFSFNKTPSKLKRAVSSMMSPFGSSTNLTPASQLAQMKLASYSNINEIGNGTSSEESLPVAPLSVQPTRKMKASSLGVNALKRL